MIFASPTAVTQQTKQHEQKSTHARDYNFSRVERGSQDGHDTCSPLLDEDAEREKKTGVRSTAFLFVSALRVTCCVVML